MNPIRLIVLCIPVSLLLLCAAAARKNVDTPPSEVIPTTNERLWLRPMTNNSGIASLDFWPRDSLKRTILERHFDEIGSKLLTEFRRCEKFGPYMMVEDSLQSTIRIAVILHPCVFRFDTLRLRVSINVSAPIDGREWNFEYTVVATAPKDRKERDPFHYAGLLMADLSNSFPYHRIVYPFYRSSVEK